MADRVGIGPLGTFDPTLLQNDGYEIRVMAQDINGQQTFSAPVAINLDGAAKIGNFRLEFTDLQIPVVGIPITITRIYDTLQASESGDFGFGWTLAAADPRIRETVQQNPLEPAAGIFATNAFKEGARVYLTNPDGRRVGFTFEPIRHDTVDVGGLQLVPPFGPVWEPYFRPDPGVTDTLSVENTPLMRSATGTFHLYLLGFNWNPSDYTLTTKEGIAYQYNQFTGLRTITDTNGNVLTYTDNGIFASSGQSIQFLRDAEGRITEIIDPAGNALVYQYDVYGDLIAFTDQNANVTTFSYLTDPAHYLNEIVDPAGHPAIRTEYDDDGRLIATRDALGNATTLVHDLANNTETIIDPLGHPTTVTYDDRGNILVQLDPLGGREEYTYDANDNEITYTNQRNFTWTRTFDARRNKTSETDPLGNTESWTYNQFSKVVTYTDKLGRIISNVYDASGNLLEATDAAGNTSYRTYDAEGRLLSVTPPCGCASQATTFVYGPGPDPIEVINADGTSKLFEYNVLGLPERITDENGHATEIAYYDVGLPRTVRDALGNYTFFDYYPGNYQLGFVLDPLNNITQYGYDATGRLVLELDPLGAATQHSYDAAGNLIQTIDRNGRVREYLYDDNNRRVQENWLTGGVVERQIHYAYDLAGNLIAASDPDSAYTYTYDALNRMTSEDNAGSPGMPHVILTYGYDAVGNVLSVEDNTGVRVDSTYDPRNLLVTRTWQGGIIDPARVDIAYDERGLRTELRRYADLAGTNQIGRTTYGFNERGFLTDLEHRDALDTVFADYHNTFDGAGQLIQEDYNGELSDYSYDPTGQLIQALRTNGPNEFFNWDANGNPEGPGYVIGTGNRLLSDGTFNYTYDAEGNMVSKVEIATGNVTTFTYDFRNRLVRVEEKTAGGILLHESVYAYDVLDRRIAVTVDGVKTITVYNGQMAWVDFDAGGAVTARYLAGTKIDELLARFRPGEGLAWYLTDRLGSVRDIVGAGGNHINHLQYSVFGVVVVQTNPAVGDRFRLAGREFDSLAQIYYFRSRYLDPFAARYVTRDPIGLTSGDTNLYRYVRNDPSNSTDPTGLLVLTEEGASRFPLPPPSPFLYVVLCTAGLFVNLFVSASVDPARALEVSFIVCALLVPLVISGPGPGPLV